MSGALFKYRKLLIIFLWIIPRLDSFPFTTIQDRHFSNDFIILFLNEYFEKILWKD